MTGKHLTVLVVPHDEGNVRRWRLSYGRLKALAALIAVALLVGAVGIATYGRIAARATRAALLERENQRLESENAKVQEIARNLERSERAYRQIREMAGLPPPETEERPASEESFSNIVEPGAPAGWPLAIKGFVTAGFSGADGHPGVDVAVPVHTAVIATADGVVKEVGDDPVYGKYVVLDHGGGRETMYAHNAALLVEIGDSVERGMTIAYSGNSGRSTAPHLHYEVREGGRAVDPAPYLQ